MRSAATLWLTPPICRSQGSADGASTFEAVCTHGSYSPPAAAVNTFVYSGQRECPVVDPLSYSGVVSIQKGCHGGGSAGGDYYLYGCDKVNVTATPYAKSDCSGKPLQPPIPIGELGCHTPTTSEASTSFTACGAVPEQATHGSTQAPPAEIATGNDAAVRAVVAAGVARALALIAAQ